MLSEAVIAPRLERVRGRIEEAANRSGRDARTVRLLLASKSQPAAAIIAAYTGGARDFGEYYGQEAVAKQAGIGKLTDLRWHMIGFLQSNKARIAATSFDMIHSLDRQSLAIALGRYNKDHRISVLIEVNIGGEASKSGVAPESVEPLIESARSLVDIRGLMTIPPPGPAATLRRYFAELRRLRDRLAKTTGLALSELSMGMTDDFEIAIEEGATIVRIGRAVFGERPR
jgi:pyridoxal phosphate enzyme (YggS family)